jgi:signal peptide peptidase SppA
MSDNVPMKILNAIYNGRWAIMPDKLDLIMAVANRTHSDMEAVLSRPLERREGGKINVRDGVAVLNVYGPILPRADYFSDISGASSISTMAMKFGEAINAKDVKAIVLDIDSPGGNTTGVHEFANQIREARGIKPIIAYTGGLCASAAYWLASAADKIVADKTATIGSIGIVAMWTDDSRAQERDGIINHELVSSQSPNKRQSPNSNEGRAALQQEVDALADIFIDSVAQNRKTSVEDVNENYGRGGVMLAGDAISVGMVDEIGSLEGVLKSVLHDAKTSIRTIKSSKKGVSFMGNKTDEEKRKKDAADAPNDEEEKEDEDEDEGEEAKSALHGVAGLLASNPSVYGQVKQLGVTEERTRLAAIYEIAQTCGHTALVKKAMFETPISAADLALQIIKSDDGKRKKAINDRLSDACEMGKVIASGGDDIDGDSTAKGIIEAMVAGLTTGGLSAKEVKHG